LRHDLKEFDSGRVCFRAFASDAYVFNPAASNAVLATLVLAKSGFSRERYPSNFKHNAIHQTMPMVAGS
jgi:hypothetical protein